MASLQHLSLSDARLLPTTEDVRYSKDAIKEIDTAIAKLEKQIQELRSKRDIYSSYLSPFRRLPIEILSEIMSIALEDGALITTLIRICSRLRHVVFGMTKVWSVIRLKTPRDGCGCKYSVYWRSMEYGTQEALEANIQYAGSTPLTITLLDQIDAEMWQPISSRNLPIRSLTFLARQTLPHIIMNLNFTSLNQLSLSMSDAPAAWAILDDIRQSTQKEIELDLELEEGMESILNHEMLRRATKLTLAGDYLRTYFESRVALPHLKTLILFDCIEFFTVAALEHLENLILHQGPMEDELRWLSLPVNLAELSLNGAYLNHTSVSEPRVCHLPRLNRLTLVNMDILGPLRHYLAFPKLKHLLVDDIRFLKTISDYEIYYEEDAAAAFCDKLFFQSIPELETLSLKEMAINSELVYCLHSCLPLRSLTIDSCIMESFISFFSDPEAHTTRLLSLREIHINRSWPCPAPISYLKFISRLGSTRTSIQIFGDGDCVRDCCHDTFDLS